MRRKTRSGKVVKLYRKVPLLDNQNAPLLDLQGTPRHTKEECVTKRAMERAVMTENETRFSRCLSCFFFTPWPSTSPCGRRESEHCLIRHQASAWSRCSTPSSSNWPAYRSYCCSVSGA